MAFDADEMGGTSHPTLKITDNLGDGVVLDITNVDQEVKGKPDTRTGDIEVNMVITGVIVSTKGAPTKSVNGEKVPVAKGDTVSLWCQYAVETKDGRVRRTKQITKGVGNACKAVGKKAPEAGGQLTLVHNELGEIPDDPKLSRAKKVAGTYTPPAPVTVGAAAGFDAGAWD